MKEVRLWHIILEIHLGDSTYDFMKFSMDDMCSLLRKWITWCHDELHEESRSLLASEIFKILCHNILIGALK